MTHRWPKQVKIVEVAPRDGLQAETIPLSVEQRVAFINELTAAGLPSVEVGSFVSPEKVPSMTHSDEVYQKIHKPPGVKYPVLVPNLHGFKRARELGVKHISIFTGASESFCKKNINCSIEESYNRFAAFLPEARAAGMHVRGYVSCIAGCPYEGEISPERVSMVVQNLLNLGCDEISLGDTTGVGTPGQIESLLDILSVPVEKLAVHFHNTYGQALANILIALEKGITIIDSSASGLGGCPFAPGASGNVATEDVVYMLKGMRIETGVDMVSLLKASQAVNQVLERKNQSSYGQAIRK